MIIRGTPSIGFSNAIPNLPTLPSVGLDQQQIIEDLTRKVENLTTVVAGKADSNKLRTLLAYSDEAILIQAQDIVLAGTVTIAKIINEQNGTTTGQVAESITQIIGDKIRTGSITSNAWGETQGTYIGLDDDIIVMGGLLNPSLVFEDGDLTISGSLTAGSFVLGKDTTLGEMADDIANAITGDDFDGFLEDALEAGVGSVLMGDGGEFVLDVGPTALYARHYLFDENGLGSGYTGDLRSGVVLTGAGVAMGYNRKADGDFIPAVSIAATGDVSILGTLIAGSIISGSATVNGTNLGTVRTNAADGKSISDTLLVSGTAVLRGVVQPTATGAIRVGSITWNSSTGALTGGTGVAITQWGIIGANSGSATFSINAATGNATFAGDISGASGTFSGNIETSGRLLATGSPSIGDFVASIHAIPSNTSAAGVYARSPSGVGVFGSTNSGQGVAGQSTTGDAIIGIAQNSAGRGVFARSNAGGNALFASTSGPGTAVRGVTTGSGVAGVFEGGISGVSASGAVAGVFVGSTRGIDVQGPSSGAAVNITQGYIVCPNNSNGRITVYDQSTNAAIATYRYTFHAA